jgi:hypothetical protein
MTRAAPTSLLALALRASGLAVALAAPGDPDASFGAGGTRVLDYGGEDSGSGVVVQPDGKAARCPHPAGVAGPVAAAPAVGAVGAVGAAPRAACRPAGGSARQSSEPRERSG